MRFSLLLQNTFHHKCSGGSFTLTFSLLTSVPHAPGVEFFMIFPISLSSVPRPHPSTLRWSTIPFGLHFPLSMTTLKTLSFKSNGMKSNHPADSQTNEASQLQKDPRLNPNVTSLPHWEFPRSRLEFFFNPAQIQKLPFRQKHPSPKEGFRVAIHARRLEICSRCFPCISFLYLRTWENDSVVTNRPVSILWSFFSGIVKR